MILWILCLAALALTTSKCEPPVNSYLPSDSISGLRPSPQYGSPRNDQRSSGGFNPSSLSFGGQRGNQYKTAGINPSSPSTEYGVPGQESEQYSRGGSRGSHAIGQGFASTSAFGNANQRGSHGAADNQFRGHGSSQKPDSSYGIPSNEYRSPSNTGFNGKSSNQGSRDSFGRSPSTSYGTPDFGNDSNNKNKNYRESGVYESNKLANYEFRYEVDDPDTGTKFSRSEQRKGDVTTGEYNVVLPDGRKQVVEYEADREGYKPQIRYEGGARDKNQEYNRGGANGNTFTGNNAQYEYQSDGGSQGKTYDQSNSGQRSATGFAGSRPDGQGFDRPGQGYTGGVGSAGYPDSDPRGNRNPISQGDYSTQPQSRKENSRSDSGRSNDFGGDDGYPRGGPNGPRGSGY